jgi:hypothetical protein
MPPSRPATVITILVGTIALSTFAYLIVGNPLDPFDNRSFSPARWKTADETGRARMARSATQFIAIGTSSSQVVSWLGDSYSVDDGPEDDGGHKLPGKQTFKWGLGSWSTFGYDDAFLYVHFDAAGRVVGSQVNGY